MTANTQAKTRSDGRQLARPGHDGVLTFGQLGSESVDEKAVAPEVQLSTCDEVV
ncbi:MAG: hypothetical protein WCF24_03220 [Acidimicrobiales bacterium]